MGSRPNNPTGSPEECATAAALITPELIAQADEIRANWWDYHPHASLPNGRALVAYPDGIWIVEDGCMLNELVRFARVADSWPIYFGTFAVTLNDHAEIPIPENERRSSLVFLAKTGDAVLAEVPAPEGGWNHAGLAVALTAQREAIAGGPIVRAMLGLEQLGSSRI